MYLKVQYGIYFIVRVLNLKLYLALSKVSYKIETLK